MNSNTENQTPPVTSSTGLQTRIQRDGGVVLELENFEKKGLYFYVKSYATHDDMVAALTAEGVLALANRALAAAQRAKANAKVQDETDADIEKRKVDNNTLLINADEATAYTPGERDVTSLSGVSKRITELRKAREEAKKANDTVKVAKLTEDLKFYVAKANDIMSAGLDE